ncbi:MAG TPA: outer membrane lipoprotein-sorting protein [Pseudomonadales bacterium]
MKLLRTTLALLLMHTTLAHANDGQKAIDSAATPEEKGIAIAEAQKARDVGWGDSQSRMKMILRTPAGNENTRMIEIKSLEVQNDGDKSLMVFNEPLDVQGTAFLSYSHVEGPDDQWIYLPALKRVKRIASRNKSGSFMGSEFSYEDLSSFEIAKYDFKYLRDEPCGEHSCYVVESYPKDEFTGYSRLVSWIEKGEYRVHKIEFYDRKQSLLKTMTVQEYTLLEDKFWRPARSLMQNHQTGKSTEMHWDNIRLRTGLSEEDFSQNNLRRAN